jgi:hypothetical protein
LPFIDERNKNEHNLKLKMMKYLQLIVGVLLIGYLIDTFFGNQSPVYKFGFEINIWIQRLFLAIGAAGFISMYFTKKKAELKNQKPN